MNWEKDISSTVYGYRTNDKVTPCFVTYHKSDEIDSNINYNDHFINPSTFAWESRSNRKLESNEIKKIINSDRIILFVKKEDGEGTDFYFMGDVSIIPNSIEQSSMPDSNLPVVHFKFKLEHPVIENIYNYIISNKKSKIARNKDQLEKSSIPLIKIDEQNKNKIHLFNFHAAAGSFSEMQNNKDYTLIDAPEKYKLNQGYFACKIIGESMNRVIPNGSICLFKIYTGGTRNGKIVLVENMDSQDPDFNSAFTIKTYWSEKIAHEDSWLHTSIILKPNSRDNNYKNIIISEEDAAGMKVVGEFITILK